MRDDELEGRRASGGEALPFLGRDDGSSSPNFESMSVSDREEKAFPATIEQYKLMGSQFLQSLSSKTEKFRPRWSPPNSRHVYHLAQRFGAFLIPSFWRTSQEPAKELHETAYLDGLRGYACYAVFFSHHTTAYCYEVWHMYGEGNNPHFVQTHYFFQLPIIRLMFNGQAAIAIFFVLSGYVLSYKPLRLIYSHDFEKLQSCLASSIFRRWIRLFLPVAALWVVNFWLVEFGAFAWFDNYKIDHPKMPPGIIEEYMSHKKGFWATASYACWTFWDYCQHTLFVWNKNGYLPEVDGHTWTLHTEFRSSCILFLFLHGTSRMVPNLRLAFFWLSTAVCLYWDEWAIGTFLAGSAIADIDLRMRRRQAQTQSQPAPMERAQYKDAEGATKMEMWQGRIKNYLIVHSKQLSWGLAFVSGLLLLSYPNTGANQIFFYAFLSRWGSPQAWDFFYWMAIGAMLLVVSAGRVRCVQRALEWRFSQYIGKTSFALYLVHGTVIKSLGHFTVIQTWEHITGFHGWGYALGIVLPLVFVVGPVTVIAADCFWRGVDIPSVKLGRWVESLVIDKTI